MDDVEYSRMPQRQMRHTEGPWEFVPGVDNEDDTENSVGSIKGGAPGALHLARVWADGPNPERDARLMAAAPVLLAALQKARAELAGLPHSLGYEFTHLPEIDAALASAGVGAA